MWLLKMIKESTVARYQTYLECAEIVNNGNYQSISHLVEILKQLAADILKNSFER